MLSSPLLLLQMLGNEHADVLDEIDQLRSKLSGLESAVMTGSFSPADVKAGRLGS